MNSSRSAALLRFIPFDTTEELTQYNTQQLPNGAMAFDSQSDTLWRLDKTIGDVFDDLVSTGALIKPADQSAARWFAETTNGASPYYHSSYLTTALSVPMTSNQWNKLGATAGSFGISAGSGLFTLSATTGLITYNGPARVALVTMQASLINGIGATPIAVHAAISRSGDVVDGGTGAYAEKGEQTQTFTNVLGVISVSRVTLLNPTTTLQMMFRNATNGDDITLSYYQATVSPL